MSFDLENFPTNETAIDMMDMVSKIYGKSYVGKWIYQVMGLRMQVPVDLIKGLLTEAFPETATWSLYLWEELYGIDTNPSLTDDERRAAIITKRNTKRPMNPARIEALLSDLTGREVELRENTDTYTYEIVIYDGDTALDIAKIWALIKEVKQAGKVVILKLAQATTIAVKPKRSKWRTHYRLCGTYPNVSTGLRIEPIAVEIGPEAAAYGADYPLAGASGETGQYPGTSTALKIGNAGIAISPETDATEEAYPLSGASGEAGQYPSTSTALDMNDSSGGISVSSEAYSVEYVLCGDDSLG